MTANSFAEAFSVSDCVRDRVKKFVRRGSPAIGDRRDTNFFRQQLAICVGCENACPPEDIGGAPGYEEFLETMADPEHPEHAEQKAWIGRDFDPKEFSSKKSTVGLRPRSIDRCG